MSEQEKMLHGKSEKLRLGQWLLLLYVAVAFVLVLAALAVHTLTQSGGIVQIYLFLPAAAGLSAVLIGGGILLFGEGVKLSALLDWLISVTFPGAFLWYVTWPVGRLLWPLAFFC